MLLFMGKSTEYWRFFSPLNPPRRSFLSKIGMRKPNENIYNYVLRDASIKAEETFFIDDTAPNIETAKRMGFITHLLLPSERVEQLNYYDGNFYLTSS